MNKLRITTDKVSFSNKVPQPNVNSQYHGRPEEYEDPADYYALPISTKGVRIA
ncbi:hypothetical protein RJP21_04965 [Paenibacillus sp. VCA1]|uniref:hypothetical protein n=1 Tax=Paenibacillus sp. VCA1 TaxID=3039148 RepID=UPI00287291B5|nr:hypothetical protein [Paenibacillus sp. VCA1]MDR9852950.1 hypothetical protein [Paenibacillus sp. VCA1]